MNTYGLGPWYVALLFNENDYLANRQRGSKRKSDVVMHTYAHRLAGIRNALNKNDNWVTIQVIGPFLRLADAAAARSLCAQKVRSKAAKIQRAFDILAKYHKPYGLRMACQTRKKEDMQPVKKRARDIVNYAKGDIQTIRDMQKRRKMN